MTRIGPDGTFVGPDGTIWTYIRKVPDQVPDGQVLVHNHVRPAKRLGVRGFRAWLQEPHDRLVVCDCGWSPHLSTHYRARRSNEEAA